MSGAREIPQKQYYKVSEVCQYTDTQPYVLSFWESEFPQLSPEKSRGGQSIYTKQDIDLVLRIKQLLHQEENTIAGARRRLEQELSGEVPPPSAVESPMREAGSPDVDRPERTAEAAARGGATAPASGGSRQEMLVFDSVPRERYEDALDEIAHLRLKLKEAETRSRRNEAATKKAEESAARHRRRAETAIERLEHLLKLLDAP